ncbi:ethylene-responsive transcription factor ERF053-like [Aegilops tauschii subsp. strangulata]|uniref:ethylene-responsive transcription factor ERF053-like n=1 Tax=Aegilops tauschii subsp. strangulata TaxID=200361 RepID=UPI00098B7D16|nr:ethylene-responsive transcription factor ERF053-like [Aegilops tauschii subsp. strangulata]
MAAKVSPSSSAGPIRHRRSPDPLAVAPLRRFEDFPVLPWTRQPMRYYLGVRQRRWWTWVSKITDRETHTRRWLRSFDTAELAAMEYNRWQDRYHGAAARLNFPFGTPPVDLVPPEPGVSHKVDVLYRLLQFMP